MRLCTGGFGFRRLWKCSGIKDIFHRAAESISDAQQQLQIYFYMTMLNITQVSLADTDIEINDENVFCRCPHCGSEVQVDFADVFADGDVDLFGTAVLCDNCSRKLMGGAACGCEQV